jgi:signal transduction histidine kinase
MTAKDADNSEPERLQARHADQTPAGARAGRLAGPNQRLERLLDLERRSLLAEQARQQAHTLRSPLSVIDLITETLRLDSTDDPVRVERLGRIHGAAASLAQGLSDSVNATRFGDGPRYLADVSLLARDVVQAFGGEVASHETAWEQGTDMVELEPASFEAALVHALRLIGVGTEACPSGDRRVVLRREQHDGVLRLSLKAISPNPPELPSERVDLRLMALAARRAAEDLGGSLVLEPNQVLFELPVPST